MRSTKNLLALIALLSMTAAIGQTVGWNKRVDCVEGHQDAGHRVLEWQDGYLVVGITWDTVYTYYQQALLTYVDTSGEIIWSQLMARDTSHFTIYGATNTTDGGFAIAGGVFADTINDWDVYVARFDADGEMLWEQQFVDTTNEGIYSMIQTSDGNFVLTGNFDPDLQSPIWADYMLMKVDGEGDLLWQKLILPTPMYEVSKDVIELPDGDLVVGGQEITDPAYWHTKRVMVARVDATADTVRWHVTLDLPNKDDYFTSLTSIGGNVYVAGQREDSTTWNHLQYFKLALAKLGVQGGIQWYHSFGDYVHDGLAMSNVRVTPSGKLVVIGSHSAQDTAMSAVFYGITQEGDLEWQQGYYGPDGSHYAYMGDLAVLSDGAGFISCGDFIPFPYPIGSRDHWMIRTDTLGCIDSGCQGTASVTHQEPSVHSSPIAHPNPSTGQFQVTGLADVYEATMFDALGRRVPITSRIKEGAIEIGMQAPSAGFYTLSLSRAGSPARPMQVRLAIEQP